MDDKFFHQLVNQAIASLPPERIAALGPVRTSEIQEGLRQAYDICLQNGGGFAILTKKLLEYGTQYNISFARAHDYISAVSARVISESDKDEVLEDNEILLRGFMEKLRYDKKQIILLNKKVSYESCKRLMRMVIERSYLNKISGETENALAYPFIVSTNYEIRGQIIARKSLNMDLFTLLSVKMSEASGELQVQYFGDKIQVSQHYFAEAFYVYLFEGDDKNTYLIFTKKDMHVGRALLRGMVVRIADMMKLGAFATSSSRLSAIIETEYVPEQDVLPDTGSAEVITRSWTHESMAKMLLGEFRHPVWFEKLLFAWLFSYKYSSYPMHLLWFAGPGSGKSSVLEAIVERAFKENIGGADLSTMRSFVPSFGQTAFEPGYMLRRSRVGGIDELFKKIQRGNEDETGWFVSLLEHKKRLAGSGKHTSTEVQATARFIFTTNPKYGLADIHEMFMKLDRAFLSRFVIYRQTKAHVAFVTKRKPITEIMSDEEKYPVYSPNLVNVTDFLQKKFIKLTLEQQEKLEAIKERCRALVPAEMADNLYDPRVNHHLLCLLDGIVKYRWVVEKRPMFHVLNADFEETEALFSTCVSSLFDFDNPEELLKLTPQARINYLPLPALKLLDAVAANPGETEYRLTFITKEPCETALKTLLNLHLITAEQKEKDGLSITVYRIHELKDELILSHNEPQSSFMKTEDI